MTPCNSRLPSSSSAGKSPRSANKSIIASHWRWLHHVPASEQMVRTRVMGDLVTQAWDPHPPLKQRVEAPPKMYALWVGKGWFPRRKSGRCYPKKWEWGTKSTTSTSYYFNIPFRDKVTTAQRQEAVCPRSYIESERKGCAPVQSPALFPSPRNAMQGKVLLTGTES